MKRHGSSCVQLLSILSPCTSFEGDKRRWTASAPTDGHRTGPHPDPLQAPLGEGDMRRHENSGGQPCRILSPCTSFEGDKRRWTASGRTDGPGPDLTPTLSKLRLERGT